MRINAADIGSFSSFNSRLSGTEEAWIFLPVDFENSFPHIANRETAIKLRIDVSVRVVADYYFTVGET